MLFILIFLGDPRASCGRGIFGDLDSVLIIGLMDLTVTGLLKYDFEIDFPVFNPNYLP